MTIKIVPNVVDETKLLDMAIAFVEDGYNELGDALLLRELFVGKLLYDHSYPSGYGWHVWAGHAWQHDKTDRVKVIAMRELGDTYSRAAARELDKVGALMMQAAELKGDKGRADELEEVNNELKVLKARVEKLRRRAEAARRVTHMRNVLEALRALGELSTDGSAWDADPWLLGVANGVVDLRLEARDRGATFRPGKPEDMIRTVAPTAWPSTGLETPTPTTDAFFADIFADKADRDEVIGYIWRVLGYGIQGEATEQVLICLYGEHGGNGKGTILETMRAVLGDYVYAADPTLLRQKDGGGAAGHNESLYKLIGKRLVFMSETNHGERVDLMRAKGISGDETLSASPKFGHEVNFKPTFTPFWLMNHRPMVAVEDEAYWRRVHVVDFGLSFVSDPDPAKPYQRKADPRLRSKLAAEAPGILAKLVKGCHDWQERGGLEPPASVLLARDEYKADNDTLGQFLADCCVVNAADELLAVPSSTLHKVYREWAAENGHKNTLGPQRFSQAMRKRFPLSRREGSGMVFRGVALMNGDADAVRDEVWLSSALEYLNKYDIERARGFAERVRATATRAQIMATIDLVARLLAAQPEQDELVELSAPSGADRRAATVVELYIRRGEFEKARAAAERIASPGLRAEKLAAIVAQLEQLELLTDAEVAP